VRPCGVTSTTLIALDDALERFELEVQQRPLVRQIALRAGIVGCEVKASYVKLIRADGMHPLHVTRRGVEWFSSQVEAVSASGLPDAVWSKINRAGTENWGVAFPRVSRPAVEVSAEGTELAGAAEPASPDAPVEVAAARAPRIVPPVRPVERDYGVCDVCWQSRTASGSCGCDD